MNFVGRLFGYGSAQSTPVLPTAANPSNEVEFDSLQVVNTDQDQSQTTENEANKKSLWHLIKGLIGVDVTTTVSLPIWLFEDTTYLQRLCEMSQFCDFLEKAGATDNQWERLIYCAAFIVAGFHGSERFDKPFNPVIGETFEYIRPDGIKFISEQVTHKPPISVGHLQGKNFSCLQQGRINVRFLGNSIDIDTNGSKGFIRFPNYDEDITWTTPRTMVSNCLVGTVWIDHYGLMPLVNHKTGDKLEVKWKRCGWFGANRYEVEGTVVDKKGTPKISFYGKWNESLHAKWLFEGGSHPKGTTVTIWENKDREQIGIHKLTNYAVKLNEMDEHLQKILPPTDSRLRPDRLALEQQKSDIAGMYKLKVEERQRTQENARKAKNEEWHSRWFKVQPDPFLDGEMYTYTGGYWEEREKKEKILDNHEQASKLLVREDYHHLACNFKGAHYQLINVSSHAENEHHHHHQHQSNNSSSSSTSTPSSISSNSSTSVPNVSSAVEEK